MIDKIISKLASNSASGIDVGNGSNDSFSTIESGDKILLPIHQTKVIHVVQYLKECNGYEKKTKETCNDLQRDKDSSEDDISNGSYSNEKLNYYGCGYL